MARREETDFKFEISISILNHLGRNLYRNFITVLGEAISNSWDADAKNVWIQINRENASFSIKDDGTGMTRDDFQDKFLKIGYSKRKDGTRTSPNRGRPYIGAKGIGKLALLSCAKRVSIFSKTEGGEYTGGAIDNAQLDEAITDDENIGKYHLDGLNSSLIKKPHDDHEHGTIIVFQDANERIRNSAEYIKKLLALSFKFSLLDNEFTIHVNDSPVTYNDLKKLSDDTQFLWTINGYKDEYVNGLKNLGLQTSELEAPLGIKGFIASVKKPANLKITGTEERATIDLFVNGRIREKNIIRHIPTQRIAESYIYGQIDFDALDQDGVDPFTSSREGVVEDDEKFKALLSYLKKTAVPKVLDEWDRLRLKRGDSGDEENPRKTRKERKARDLYTEVKAEYALDKDAPEKDRVDTWLSELREDGEFNSSAYLDCFLSENLVRKCIEAQSLAIKPELVKEAKKWREAEANKKAKANISYEIRKDDNDSAYLGMNDLASSAEGEKGDGKSQSLWRDVLPYALVRNVVGHTGLLTADAKDHLRHMHNNIKARVKKLISGAKISPKSSPKKKK